MDWMIESALLLAPMWVGFPGALKEFAVMFPGDWRWFDNEYEPNYPFDIAIRYTT